MSTQPTENNKRKKNLIATIVTTGAELVTSPPPWHSMEHAFQISHSRAGVRAPSCIPCCTRCGWAADFMLPQSVTPQSNANPRYLPSPFLPLPLHLPPVDLSHRQTKARADDMQKTAMSTPAPGRRIKSRAREHVCPAISVWGCAQGSLGTPLPVQNSCLLECSSSSSPPELGGAGGDTVLVYLFWSMHLVSLMSLFMCW